MPRVCKVCYDSNYNKTLIIKEEHNVERHYINANRRHEAGDRIPPHPINAQIKTYNVVNDIVIVDRRECSKLVQKDLFGNIVNAKILTKTGKLKRKRTAIFPNETNPQSKRPKKQIQTLQELRDTIERKRNMTENDIKNYTKRSLDAKWVKDLKIVLNNKKNVNIILQKYDNPHTKLKINKSALV
eukprot:273783_1